MAWAWVCAVRLYRMYCGGRRGSSVGRVGASNFFCEDCASCGLTPRRSVSRRLREGQTWCGARRPTASTANHLEGMVLRLVSPAHELHEVSSEDEGELLKLVADHQRLYDRHWNDNMLQLSRFRPKLHEGYVETKHAVDNRLAPRFHQVQNPERRVLLRSRVHWQSEAPGAINIRQLDQERESTCLETASTDARSAREIAARAREARLDRQDEEGSMVVVRVVRR